VFRPRVAHRQRPLGGDNVRAWLHALLDRLVAGTPDQEGERQRGQAHEADGHVHGAIPPGAVRARPTHGTDSGSGVDRNRLLPLPTRAPVAQSSAQSRSDFSPKAS
jgi:hypothetical protein